MNLDQLTTSEQMEIYKQETGVKNINVYAFETWKFYKFLETL